MAIKAQANFYNLRQAGEKMNFPFAAQILPTLLINDFQHNAHHKVTFLSKETLQKRVHIKQRNRQETSFTLVDVDVQCLYLNNHVTYNTIRNVIRRRKTDDINFLTVMSKSVFNEQVLDIGDVLYLQPSTFLDKNVLKCILMQGNHRLALPDSLSIELRKCSDARDMKTERLADLLNSDNLPCLITFQQDFEGVDNNGYFLASERVLLDGYSSEGILLASRKIPSAKRIEILTLLLDMDVDIEILHGDTPVAEFTTNQIRSMMQCIKKEKNLLTGHKKFQIDKLKLNLCDYNYPCELGLRKWHDYENLLDSEHEYQDEPLQQQQDFGDSKPDDSSKMHMVETMSKVFRNQEQQDNHGYLLPIELIRQNSGEIMNHVTSTTNFKTTVDSENLMDSEHEYQDEPLQQQQDFANSKPDDTSKMHIVETMSKLFRNQKQQDDHWYLLPIELIRKNAGEIMNPVTRTTIQPNLKTTVDSAHIKITEQSSEEKTNKSQKYVEMPRRNYDRFVESNNQDYGKNAGTSSYVTLSERSGNEYVFYY